MGNYRQQNKKPFRPKETARHQEAFEYFYTLGDRRQQEDVARKFSISSVTANNWRSKFNWDDRIEKRNRKIAKTIERKTDTDIVEVKIKYRMEIKTQLKMVNEVIKDVIDPRTGKIKLKIKNIMDFSKITSIYERLVRLDLDVLGDAPMQNNAPIFKLVDALAAVVQTGYKQEVNVQVADKIINKEVKRK